MTINGPAPTILAMFLNTAIDQQLDAFAQKRTAARRRRRGRGNPRAHAANGARHRAGRYPEGRPGPEHLPLLDRVFAQGDGRHRRVFRARAGAQFLLGVDLRLSHRRSRREPDLAAGVHARQRLHLRRSVSRARHADRRLRAQPVVLFSQRHGPRIFRDRARRAPHLGDRDARRLRRRTSAARNSNITRKPRGARCTRRKSTSTTSARRCRR